MTREEILDELPKVKRTCRGNAVLPQSVRDSLFNEWAQCGDDGSKAVFLQKLLTSLEMPSEDGVPHELRVHGLIFSFKEDCGADFNEVISTYPFDGKLREIPCPNCGAVQIIQSPLEG